MDLSHLWWVYWQAGDTYYYEKSSIKIFFSKPEAFISPWFIFTLGQYISYAHLCEESAGFHHHEATVHMAHCCNEGVMFLPLIYPDYTIKRESLLMEPCVPPLHLSIHLFSSFNFWGTSTVPYSGRTRSRSNNSIGISVNKHIRMSSIMH